MAVSGAPAASGSSYPPPMHTVSEGDGGGNIASPGDLRQSASKTTGQAAGMWQGSAGMAGPHRLRLFVNDKLAAGRASSSQGHTFLGSQSAPVVRLPFHVKHFRFLWFKPAAPRSAQSGIKSMAYVRIGCATNSDEIHGGGGGRLPSDVLRPDACAFSDLPSTCALGDS